MKVEIKHNNLDVKFSKDELENMALAMQKELEKNNHIVSIKMCLDIVSQQFGFTYQEIIDKFEYLDYQCKKYHLIQKWIECFIALNFNGWKIKTIIVDEEEGIEFLEYEIFGEVLGTRMDLDDVYEIFWENLLEIIYLEIQNNRIKTLEFENKDYLEKYLLQNTSAENPKINMILHNIHNNMSLLDKDIKIELLNNIQHHYLLNLKDNRILYGKNNLLVS